MCLGELHEYDEVCKRATQIQEHISEVFKKTQKKFKLTKNLIKCEVCMAQYVSKEAFDKHECVIDEEENCEMFGMEDDYDDFKEAGTSKKKLEMYAQYTCNTCNKTFERKRDYDYHAKVGHLPEGTKILSCDSCQKSHENIFTSDLELKLHHAIYHTELKNGRYQCPECDKSFNSKHVLIRHFNIHSQEKPMVSHLVLSCFHEGHVKSFVFFFF
jgi:Zinc finger, C2H2 type